MKLLHGERVQVRRSGEGLSGTWNTGRVIDMEVRSRIVEYDHLFSIDNCSKLQESIPVSAAIDGQIESSPENYQGHIRPSPSCYDLHESEIRYGLCVDALVDDAWHEGVVFDRADRSKQRLIFFPDTGDQHAIDVEQLQVTRDWNEVSGEWKARGEWLLLQAIRPFEREDGLPVSVRQIWYDLRTMVGFSEKIGAWTCGSYDAWYRLLAELIKQLRAVAPSLPALERLLHPMSFDAADIPVKDFPCSSVVAAAADNPMADFPWMDGLDISHTDSAAMDDNFLCSRVGTLDDRSFLDILLQGNNARASSLDIGRKELDEINTNPIWNNDNDEDDNVTESRDSEGWIPLDLEAAYDPESIQLCVDHYEDGRSRPKELGESNDSISRVRLKAKKHLLAVGWKIESRIRWKRNVSRVRTRFVSPKGRLYMSLHVACCGFLKENKEKNPESRNEVACVQQDFQKVNSDTADVLMGDFSWTGVIDLLHTDTGDIEDNFFHSDDFSCVDISFLDVDTEVGVHGEEDLLLSGSNELNANVMSSNDNAKDDIVTNSRDSEGWTPLDIEAEYDPQSIRLCVDHSEDGTHGSNELISSIRLKAKKHLLAVGWKIESRTRWTGNVSRVRTRFVSPEGRLYQSLHMACCGLLKEISPKVPNEMLEKENLESSEIRKRRAVHLKECRESKKRKMATRMSSPPSAESSCVPRTSKRSKYPVAEAPGHHVPRTVLSLLVDEDMVLPRQKVRYVRRRDGRVLKEGRITRDGIKCECCKLVYTLSNFGAHADSIKRRSLNANILLQDGRSLLDCQMQMMHRKNPRDFQRSRVKIDYSAYETDIICSFCHDGGSLVLCDHCPSAYHLGCVGLKDVPEGEWFCPSCRCSVCGQSELDCNTQLLTEKTVVYCDQCEREFHVGCMRERVRSRSSRFPTGNWFCSRKCSKIFLHLRKLLGKSRPTAIEGLSLTILRSGSESGVHGQPFDAETVANHDSKLRVALSVLHECFVPITEPRTQSDFVADLLFNKESELRRLNFYGFYTVILERGDELISVATFRVYGEKVAEMPLIGTRVKYRKQGMCRLLVNELEKLLLALGVEKLLLPAVPQVLETWTGSFGFSKMSISDRLDLQEYTLLNFEDTTMCQKLLGNTKTVSKAVKIDSEIARTESSCTRPVSNCVSPTEETLPENSFFNQSQLNTSPGKSCHSNVNFLEISPKIMVKSSTSNNLKFFRRCPERRRRVLANKQPLVFTK